MNSKRCIVRAFLVAELFRILVYANYMTCDRLTTEKECKITKEYQYKYKADRVKIL